MVRKTLAMALFMAAMAAPWPLVAQAAEPGVETADTKAMVAAFFDQVFVRGDVRDGILRYIAEDYIQHNPLAADGRDAVLKFFEAIPADKLPKVTLARIVAEGDLAAVHYKSEFPGGPSLAVVDIFRVQDGKIVEHWDVVQPMPSTSANPHPMF